MNTERSPLRVAFLDNMNNNGFALVRFLRDRGIDAELLLFDNTFDHFHPAADTYDLDYMAFTRQLSWGSSVRFLSTSAEQIRRDLQSYDVLIGCGLAPAYCEKAGRVLDVFVPYGEDIWGATEYAAASPHRLPSIWSSVHFQRRGIKRSRIFHMPITNAFFEGQYAKLHGGSQRWTVGLAMIHTPTFAPERMAEMQNRTHWGHEFNRIRSEHDLMVLSHGRHVFNYASGNTKGTEQLLHGWSLFHRF